MPTISQYNKELKEHKENRKDYKLEGNDKEASDFFEERKTELKRARKNVLGKNIENIWRAADRAYVPHTLEVAKGKKVFVSDDELGWRSTAVNLGKSDDWMEQSVPTNPYSKIQTALSILIDRNPQVVFKALSEKYEGSNILHKELYTRNWDVADSKEQLKITVLNGAKYGIICGITQPLKIQRQVRNLTNYFPEDPSKNTYEDEVVTIYDDVYRWALNPWTVWFDDMAKPGDKYSMNDWIRYKDFSWERFREQFKGFKNYKAVVPKSVEIKQESKEGPDVDKVFKKDVVRLWYYENLARDMFYVQSDDGVVLINEPIPHEPKNKRLSCWVAPWTLRHSDTIYGIGTYEAMRNDYKLYLKVRNMTVDQLVLSIYKEFFYEGTNTLQNTGEMRIKPGTGRQISGGKIQWSEVPGPGKEAWDALGFIKNEIDDATGITKTLEGELSPNAKAFDIAQAREASLRRMKTPLNNIAFALEQDAYISVGLFEELYSIPEIEDITDPKEIAKYRAQIAQGEIRPELVEEIFSEEEGFEQEVTGLRVKTFRTAPLFLERDNEGNLLQIKEEKFFEIKPEDLPWEGKISMVGQSIVAESPLLEKQNKLELANLLIPLFAQPPEIVLPAARELLKVYKEEPEDWFPFTWLEFMEKGEQEEKPPLFVPGRGGQQEVDQPPKQIQEAEKVVPDTEIRGGEGSLVGRLVSRLNPFKGRQ